MTAPRLLLLAVVVAATALARVAPAHAERVVVLVGGELAASERQPLTLAARAAAEANGWTLAELALDDRALEDLVVCAAGEAQQTCVARALEGTKAERALIVRATKEKHGKEEVRVLTGWVFRRNGTLVVVEQRFCERCRLDALQVHARDLVGALIRRARAKIQPSVIAVRSSPPGARVSIGTDAVGATDMELEVRAGRHSVRIEKDGYHPETREVSLADGERVELDVELRVRGAVETPAVPPPPPPGPSKLLPWLAIGAGAALVVTGGVLFAMDEDEVVGGEAVPRYRDTAPLGVAAGAVGLAAIGAGVYLLVRRGGDERSPAPTAGRTGEVTWFGVRGAF